MTKKGIKTNNTIRTNNYDHKFYKQSPMFITKDNIPVSLNHHKGWELIENYNITKYKIHY